MAPPGARAASGGGRRVVTRRRRPHRPQRPVGGGGAGPVPAPRPGHGRVGRGRIGAAQAPQGAAVDLPGRRGRADRPVRRAPGGLRPRRRLAAGRRRGGGTSVGHLGHRPDRARFAPILLDRFGRHFRFEGELADGRVRVRVAAPAPLDLARTLAGWGAMIEVVEPETVRDELARIGAELTARYSSP
ncbi:WYL domain-containing protein [Microbispora sp. ATCC PTA-5024]|uniref:WYL domain-containing protein n=1 Tax=Microbispora sp. ATCC PTA-5024 TaxID=316330 RepID=UPI001E4B5E4B|nr:WYL domain-containing protein [Microbispora sp. ATCC PTA-5024]